MKKQELQRLIKIEGAINKIIQDELGLDCTPMEFDIIPDSKMLEIMAYRSPSQISSWKYGRDYERLRTLFEKTERGLPYEVVVPGRLARCYLMNSNTFPVHCTVMAHATGHVTFFTMNKWFQNNRDDFLDVMSAKGIAYLEYERTYGIDEVERIVDAGHALQYHSSPFDNETENEKRERIYRQKRQQRAASHRSEFSDMIPRKEKLGDSGDIELYNQRLKRELRLKSPVEPTEDILRYIIDNSNQLEDWHKDILEMLREEGRQLWASVQTHFMNEGWSVMIHEKVMNRLFDMRLLTTEEHGSYNYSNSRIKAKHPTQLNPYLVGSEQWYSIEERWNKGMHGQEWEDCTSIHEKENWDTGAMEGWKKCKEVQRSYTDWFFFQDFFTEDLVEQLELYLWGQRETMVTVDTIRTRHTTKEIRNAIISSFSHNRVPKIEVIDGNFRNGILLTHRHTGPDLDMKYTIETMKHIFNVTGQDVYVDTIIEKKRRLISVFLDKKDGQVKIQILEKQGAPSTAEAGTGGNPGPT